MTAPESFTANPFGWDDMTIVLVMLPDGEWFDICVAATLVGALQWFADICEPGEQYRVICDPRGVDYQVSK